MAGIGWYRIERKGGALTLWRELLEVVGWVTRARGRVFDGNQSKRKSGSSDTRRTFAKVRAAMAQGGPQV